MTKNNFIPSTVFIEKLPDICVDLQLVSIYDMDCYSVPQLLYRLAQKINDTITNMEHNDEALKAHLEDLQVKLEYLLGEGLTTELQKLIEKMYADGSLQSLVEESMVNINKRLDNIDSQLEDNELITINLLKYKNLFDGNDITLALKKVIDMYDNIKITIPKGAWILSDIITIKKYITIEGSGVRNTRIYKKHNLNMFSYEGIEDNYIALSRMGVTNLTIQGENTTGDIFNIKYFAVGLFENLIINDSKGNGFSIYCGQDIDFEKVYFRNVGDKTLSDKTACVKLLQSIQTDINKGHNVNVLRFTNCTFEHYTGQFIIQNGTTNNNISFINCKFEYGENIEHSDIESPIFLNNATGFEFVGCKYSSFKNMFYIINSKTINIGGIVINKSYPRAFATIEDSNNIEIDVKGYLTGGIKEIGNTFNIVKNNVDIEYYTETKELLKIANENQIITPNSLVYQSSSTGNIIENGVLKCTSKSNTPCLINLISNTPLQLKGGLTLFFKCKSTNGKGYDFKLRYMDIDGQMKTILLENKYISNTMNTFMLTIPGEYFKYGKTLIQVYTQNSHPINENLYIESIYYEKKYYSDNVPTLNTWQVGDILYTRNMTSNSFFMRICVTNGTGIESVWKGL